MKRYLLFAGYTFYPGGGWDDFKDSFDTLEEAHAAYKRMHDEEGKDWGQIVDTETWEISTF